MAVYEITVTLPNGDSLCWRDEYRDFQTACEDGLSRIENTHPTNRYRDGRLVSVVDIPALTPLPPRDELAAIRTVLNDLNETTLPELASACWNAGCQDTSDAIEHACRGISQALHDLRLAELRSRLPKYSRL